MLSSVHYSKHFLDSVKHHKKLLQGVPKNATTLANISIKGAPEILLRIGITLAVGGDERGPSEEGANSIATHPTNPNRNSKTMKLASF